MLVMNDVFSVNDMGRTVSLQYSNNNSKPQLALNGHHTDNRRSENLNLIFSDSMLGAVQSILSSVQKINDVDLRATLLRQQFIFVVLFVRILSRSFTYNNTSQIDLDL